MLLFVEQFFPVEDDSEDYFIWKYGLSKFLCVNNLYWTKYLHRSSQIRRNYSSYKFNVYFSFSIIGNKRQASVNDWYEKIYM